MEHRQFIYLDSLAVRSLLASHSIAAPDIVKEKTEAVTKGGGGVDFNVGFDVPYFGKAEAGADFSGSKTGRDVFETSKRINDQYIFNILYEALNDENHIVDFTEGNSSYSKFDVIKLRGTVKTDAIFRILNILTTLFDIADQNEDLESINEAREILYSDQIGLSIDIENSKSSFGMTLDSDNLWVEQEREFLGAREYVVLGRVRETIPGDEKWDYADLMRIGNTVVSKDTMDDIRNLLSQLINSVGDFQQRYDLPDFGNVGIQDIQDESIDSTESMFELDIKDDEVTLDGPGCVIHPIAIYW